MNNKIICAALAFILAGAQMNSVQASWTDFSNSTTKKSLSKSFIGGDNIFDKFETAEKNLEKLIKSSAYTAIYKDFYKFNSQIKKDLVKNYFKTLEELFEGLRKPIKESKIREKFDKFIKYRKILITYLRETENSSFTYYSSHLGMDKLKTHFEAAVEAVRNIKSSQETTTAGRLANNAIYYLCEDWELFSKLMQITQTSPVTGQTGVTQQQPISDVKKIGRWR